MARVLVILSVVSCLPAVECLDVEGDHISLLQTRAERMVAAASTAIHSNLGDVEAVPNPCPEGWFPFNGNKDCYLKGKHPGGYNNPESNARCTLSGAGNGYNSWYPECSEIQADVDPNEVEEHSQCDADHGASHRCCGQQGTGATGVRKSCPGSRPVCKNFQHNVHWGTCQATTTTTTTTISLDGSDDDAPTTTTTTTTISLDGLDDDEREVEVEDEQANRHECLNWCYSKKHKDKSWEGYKCNWYACSACPEC